MRRKESPPAGCLSRSIGRQWLESVSLMRWPRIQSLYCFLARSPCAKRAHRHISAAADTFSIASRSICLNTIDNKLFYIVFPLLFPVLQPSPIDRVPCECRRRRRRWRYARFGAATIYWGWKGKNIAGANAVATTPWFCRRCDNKWQGSFPTSSVNCFFFPIIFVFPRSINQSIVFVGHSADKERKKERIRKKKWCRQLNERFMWFLLVFCYPLNKSILFGVECKRSIDDLRYEFKWRLAISAHGLRVIAANPGNKGNHNKKIKTGASVQLCDNFFVRRSTTEQPAECPGDAARQHVCN